jgi:hypothetical protein
MRGMVEGQSAFWTSSRGDVALDQNCRANRSQVSKRIVSVAFVKPNFRSLLRATDGSPCRIRQASTATTSCGSTIQL